ncbi:MAG: hypothetical protein RLZ19_1109 [Actinomycetota bacterium]|jgi:phosphatidylinositol alpha 1,6-mannosyltransferase
MSETAIRNEVPRAIGPVTVSSHDHGRLRILVVTETFLPQVNGVVNSVLRVLEHMGARGHELLVVAPGPGSEAAAGVSIIRTRSIGLPMYRDLRIGVSRKEVAVAMEAFGPDVVHVAAPTVLGNLALKEAQRRGIPTVSVYQTDLAGFATRYRLSVANSGIWAHTVRVHRRSGLSLAPSTAAMWDLRHRGVPHVKRWMRGVDGVKFDPRYRCEDFRRSIAPKGEVIVGYVGRLAREKQVERLVEVSRLPNVRLVIAGDGPYRAKLERDMPTAHFTGFLQGEELSRCYASLDLFVHTGIDETFCQSVQEALAAGVPVVAPARGGPLDLVRHGENGYLWSPDSDVSLIGAVCELVENSIKREKMAARARESVIERTWTSVMSELEGHYRSVVSGLEFAYRELR